MKSQAKPAKVKPPSKPAKAAGKSRGVATLPALAKPAAKKAATKALPKVATKPVVKTAASKAAKPVAKSASKPGTKAVLKTASGNKKAAPVAAKKAVTAAPRNGNKSVPAPVKPAIQIASAAKAKAAGKSEPLMSANIQTKPDPKPAPVAAPSAPSAQTVTQRPGRPSSRLASLTVPSMAQSVASTAAKASFVQLTSAPLIVPPLPSATRKDPKLANNWKLKPVDQLTDAELLAMPDSEYMNEKQMAAFRLKLSQLKQEILNSAGETTEHLREDTVVVPDPADRATIEEEHALELRTRDRERKLLKKIEQSIGRIDAGDYGYCDETGEPIGVGRLLARPTATLSLEAQQRRELKQKMFGD